MWDLHPSVGAASECNIMIVPQTLLGLIRLAYAQFGMFAIARNRQNKTLGLGNLDDITQFIPSVISPESRF